MKPERRPVGIRQCDEAMLNFQRYGSRKPVPHVTDETEQGAGVRAELGRRLSSGQLAGLGKSAQYPPWLSAMRIRPSLCRMAPLPPEPEDSRSLHPNQPSGLPCAACMAVRWTLDPRPIWSRFYAAAVSRCSGRVRHFRRRFDVRGVPLETVEIDDPAIAELYERSLVLVRPDGHVAWRGDRLPGDCAALTDRVRGALPSALRQKRHGSWSWNEKQPNMVTNP